jgi:hypothetical protein
MIMNLGKLLFAGKSIASGQGAVSYREDKSVCLPKFNLEPQKKSAVAPAKSAAKPSNVAASAPKAISPFVAKKPASGESEKRPAGWTSKLNPISMLRVSPPQPERPVVQTELSLDSVKVVHNDLSDADVPVVPMKSRSAAEMSAQAPEEKSWESLTKRLLKATAL